MSDATENHCGGSDEPHAKMHATVWRIPREIPDEGRPGEVPNCPPEFWMCEHRMPGYISLSQIRGDPYSMRGCGHEITFLAQAVHRLPKTAPRRTLSSGDPSEWDSTLGTRATETQASRRPPTTTRGNDWDCLLVSDLDREFLWRTAEAIEGAVELHTVLLAAQRVPEGKER